MTPVHIPDSAHSDPDTVRVGTYARQSHRHEADSKSSPLAQRHSGEAYTSSQPGWRHVAHYEDIGVSGYDPNAYRPGFEEMMNDVRAGKLDVIVVMALSRLTRKGVLDALEIRAELEKHGVGLVSVTEPFVNTAHDNPFAVAFFALIAALAHQESKNKSEFIRRSFGEIQARGGHVAGRVPWWAEAVTEMVDGVEIRILKPRDDVRHIGERIVDLAEEGITAWSIAKQYDEESIPPPKKLNPSDNKAEEGDEDDADKDDKGSPGWTGEAISRFLQDPRIAGFATATQELKDKRLNRREIMRDEDGAPIAPHTGLITPDRWYALQDKLSGRRRPFAPPRGDAERTLLGVWGIAVCGKCAHTLYCAHGPGDYHCNLPRVLTRGQARHTVRIRMKVLDEFVASRVWARVEALDPLTNDEDAALLAEATRRFAHNSASPLVESERLSVKAQLAHVRGTLEQLYADRADGLYAGTTGRGMFAKQVKQLNAHEESCALRLEELDEAAHTATVLPLNDWSGGEDSPLSPEGPWAAWSITEQREFLALWVDRVIVHPAVLEGPRNERTAKRVEIVWATPPAEDDAEDLETA